MTTERDKLVRFICAHDPNSLSSVAVEKAACKMLAKKGPDWLSYFQLKDMADNAAAEWRFTENLNEENRARQRDAEAAGVLGRCRREDVGR